ncbi:MAG: YceI family protein [Opitutaceae bacterium]|jgi:polyisoprenoid-binding protein YceI
MKLIYKTLVLAGFAAGLVSAASAAVETYAIDPVHSSVTFSVRHFLTRVPGHFAKFTGTITVDRDNLENSSVVATIDVGSVSTDNEKRDNHLKSPDFFDAAKFDSIAFKSTSWKKTGEGTFDVAGDLTIHGVTKPVVLKVDLLGFGPGMMGAQLSGWDASVTLNRRDFGVNGPAMLGKALGDDVGVSITIEADLKK